MQKHFSISACWTAKPHAMGTGYFNVIREACMAKMRLTMRESTGSALARSSDHAKHVSPMKTAWPGLLDVGSSLHLCVKQKNYNSRVEIEPSLKWLVVYARLGSQAKSSRTSNGKSSVGCWLQLSRSTSQSYLCISGM